VLQGHPGEKVRKTISQPIKKLGTVVHTCHSSYTGSISRRIIVQAILGKNTIPTSKTVKAKRDLGMAQEVE
jgi:hypothetical protein